MGKLLPSPTPPEQAEKMMAITPFIDIRSGRAQFITRPEPMESGYNRSDEACTLDAHKDWDTVIEFLNEYKSSIKTLKSYTNEMERFISWLIQKANVPVSALKRSHADEYMQFLIAPDPSWCGLRVSKFKKDGSVKSGWRPFSKNAEGECGLSNATARRSRKILDSYFKYLVDNNYLYGNPLISRRTKGQRKKKTKKTVERFFEVEEILFILESLQHYQEILDENDHSARFQVVRSRYLFLLYLHTGMRISEPTSYTMGDLENKNGNWKLFVQGKGDEADEGRDIALGQDFIEALKAFRLAVELPALPLYEESTPLIPQEDLKKPIAERQLSNIFRWLFDLAAEYQETLANELKVDSEDYAQMKRLVSKFNKATCHWLRHSHATYYLKITDDLKSTQERLGHTDVSTTMIYLHTLEQNKTEQADKFSLSEITKV